MYDQKSAQSGFSLIELLIAVVILAIGLLGLAELQISAIKTNTQSDSITVANGLAQKVVEEIAAMGANDAIFASDSPAVANPFATWPSWNGSPYSIPNAGVYNVTYKVDADYESVTGLSQITIQVRSANAISNVLGNRVRSVDVITFKRSF